MSPLQWLEFWKDRFWRRESEQDRLAGEALRERAAALPREQEPSRDLWLGIQNQIQHPEGASVPSESRASRGAFLTVPSWAAASMAALLLAVGVGAGLWWNNDTLSLDDPAAVRALAASLRERDGVYEVHESLLTMLAELGNQLPPEVVDVLENSLASIDRAIAEIHIAFEAHPNDAGIQLLLAEAYRREADMLEQLEWWTKPVSQVPAAAVNEVKS